MHDCFMNGTVGTIISSFDTQGTKIPNIEIYGTAGTLIVPDPNTFSGPVYIKWHNQSEFMELALTTDSRTTAAD